MNQDTVCDALSLGQCATLAAIMEATAPKPGNVHRGADFDHLTYPDFLISAVVVGPIFDRAAEVSVGRTILSAIQATRRAVAANTNLGMVLLMAPLAKVPRNRPLREGIAAVLAGLTADDSRDVYAAINLAAPGGMGHDDENDLAAPPPSDLLVAMRAAADRDLVARQYAENFGQVLGSVVPRLVEGLAAGWPLSDTIVQTQLRLMAEFPDSLIGRMHGAAVAGQSAAHAATVLAAGPPGSSEQLEALADLDFWLRSAPNRNPGTTADLIAAGLFAALRNGIIKPPWRLASRRE